MVTWIAKTLRFLRDEDGPTAVEYAIMLALIITVCVGAIQAVGSGTNSKFADPTLNAALGS
jgi:pilus assembly protein Flp/PilA